MTIMRLAFGLALALHMGFASAQDWPTRSGYASAQDWPSRPIRLIIGFPPGGGADAVARPIAEALSRQLGQTVIVDNRPGGGSTIAAAAVATAVPDGYTLFMHNASIYGSLQAIFKDFKFGGKDFTPITRWTNAPLLVVVSNDLGVNNIAGLVKRARAQPGKLNYASSGVGGGTHLPGLLFMREAGIDMTHVPYKGGASALQGVVTGETQLTFATPPSALPLARAARVKAIAVTSAGRSPLFPDLPTVSESGVPGYDFTFWFGLFGPAGLPEAIVSKLFESSKVVLNDPALRDRLIASGNEPAPSQSPGEFREWAAKSGAEQLELTLEAGAHSD